MTPVEDEPRSLGALTVFAVHGLPDKDSDPTEQLRPLREALAIDQAHWRDHVWCPVTTSIAVGRRVLSPLRNPDFDFAAYRVFHDPPYDEQDPQPFAPWFANELEALPVGVPVVIIAYSAGAYLVYKWLATHATAQDVARISAIICLAGPHSFARNSLGQTEQELAFAHNPNLRVTVREPVIEPRAIAQFLRSHQLLTLLAGNDITIGPMYASFRNTAAASVIDEDNVQDAEHHTICGHEQTAAIVHARLTSLPGVLPPHPKDAVTLGQPRAK